MWHSYPAVPDRDDEPIQQLTNLSLQIAIPHGMDSTRLMHQGFTSIIFVLVGLILEHWKKSNYQIRVRPARNMWLWTSNGNAAQAAICDGLALNILVTRPFRDMYQRFMDVWLFHPFF